MSHLPERKERICLNCKSVVYGRFCHICGQENREPKETIWGLITHFIYDITHFDGKFFDTTRHLLFRPGYLAYEYLRGRRASYLNPIRMYVFTSAFFFILFFTFINDGTGNAGTIAEQRAELIEEKQQLESSIAREADPKKKKKLQKELSQLNNQLAMVGQTGIIRIGENVDAGDSSRVFGSNDWPATVQEYDSIQSSIPESERDNWFMKLGIRRMIAINEKYKYNPWEFWRRSKEKFNHYVPQMMFVSLPLVALVLQLLYVRRKQYYYVNHVIFTINLYIAVYLLLLLFYGLAAVYGLTGLGVFQVLAVITYLAIFFYAYKAMRNFYRQGRAKTILKFTLFIMAFLVLLLLLMGIYFLTSALQI